MKYKFEYIEAEDSLNIIGGKIFDVEITEYRMIFS